MAGDKFNVVDTEARAREIAEYRARRIREKEAQIAARGSVEQMLSAIAAGEAEELPIVIKTDVHGSLEAIRVALEKLGTDQVKGADSDCRCWCDFRIRHISCFSLFCDGDRL